MVKDEDVIVELMKQGLGGTAIRELYPETKPGAMFRLYRKAFPVRRTNPGKSHEYAIGPAFAPIVEECLRRIGKDKATCEMCGAKPKGGCTIHHTKYEGATIYDLMYVCKSCNTAPANTRLA